jgi:hypothetical protein
VTGSVDAQALCEFKALEELKLKFTSSSDRGTFNFEDVVAWPPLLKKLSVAGATSGKEGGETQTINAGALPRCLRDFAISGLQCHCRTRMDLSLLPSGLQSLWVGYCTNLDLFVSDPLRFPLALPGWSTHSMNLFRVAIGAAPDAPTISGDLFYERCKELQCEYGWT